MPRQSALRPIQQVARRSSPRSGQQRGRGASRPSTPSALARPGPFTLFIAAPIERPDVELPKVVELKGDPKTEVSANDLGRLAGAAERRADK